MAGITYTKAPTAPAGGIAIGDLVAGGNPDRVLYINGAGVLSDYPLFLFDDVTEKFSAESVNILGQDLNYITGQLKITGGSGLTNNFFHNHFVAGPLGLGTLLQASIFTLEGVKTIQQSFTTSIINQSRIGSFIMVAGVGTFAATWITAAHVVFISPLVNDLLSHGNASVVITAGVGVTITSSNVLDATSYNIIVFNTF
jgi:hypothetical protein